MPKITFRSDLVITPCMLANHGIAYIPYIVSKKQKAETITDILVKKKGSIEGTIEVIGVFYQAISGESKDKDYITKNLYELVKLYGFCRRNSLKTFSSIVELDEDILENAYIMNKYNPYSVYYTGGTELDRYLFNYLSVRTGLYGEIKRCRNKAKS